VATGLHTLPSVSGETKYLGLFSDFLSALFSRRAYERVAQGVNRTRALES